jgi:hypothetical protein
LLACYNINGDGSWILYDKIPRHLEVVVDWRKMQLSFLSGVQSECAKLSEWSDQLWKPFTSKLELFLLLSSLELCNIWCTTIHIVVLLHFIYLYSWYGFLDKNDSIIHLVLLITICLYILCTTIKLGELYCNYIPYMLYRYLCSIIKF